MIVGIMLEEGDLQIQATDFLKKRVPDKRLREILHYSEAEVLRNSNVMTHEIVYEDDQEYIRKNFPDLLI